MIKSDLPVADLKMGKSEIYVEVANKDVTREAGLMFRRKLEWDNGMLFVFNDSAVRYFWMKNTFIPLSIAFIDDQGKILNILEMPPQTEQTFPSAGPAKYALEMNSGWFAKEGIKPGDVIQGLVEAPKSQD